MLCTPRYLLQPRELRGQAFSEISLNPLLPLLPCDVGTKRRSARCARHVCFVCVPRSVSLPSQGQMEVEPSGSESKPEALGCKKD